MSGGIDRPELDSIVKGWRSCTGVIININIAGGDETEDSDNRRFRKHHQRDPWACVSLVGRLSVGLSSC